MDRDLLFDKKLCLSCIDTGGVEACRGCSRVTLLDGVYV